jgi:hypothetical protein
LDATLQKDIQLNKIGHAYLLCTPDKQYGIDTAREFIISALSAGVSEARLIREGRHADVTEYPRETQKKGEKPQITVADVDSLVSSVLKRPSKGERRFFIISNAETMSRQSQNKLLKTIEDPPGGVCIILVSAISGAILPTIVSRSRVIALSAAGEFSLKGKEDLIIPIAEVLIGISSSKAVLNAAYELSKYKDRLKEVTEVIRFLLRDALVYKTGQNGLMFLKDFESAVSGISGVYSGTAIIKIFPLLDKADKRLQLYANAVSVIDELCFTLAECRVRYK